jgi:hypothetical protein
MLMKSALALLAAATLLAGAAFAQSDVIIKKRAQEIRDQNNVRQGVAAPSQSRQPSQPTASSSPTAPTTLLQQNLAKVRSDLAAIHANAAITPAQKQQLTKDLLACAQGSSKPSSATVAALAESLLAASAQKPLSDASRSRLVSNIAAVLNPANIQASQMQAVYADIQAIFQANGMARKDAVKIADQVKAVGAEAR